MTPDKKRPSATGNISVTVFVNGTLQYEQSKEISRLATQSRPRIDSRDIAIPEYFREVDLAEGQKEKSRLDREKAQRENKKAALFQRITECPRGKVKVPSRNVSGSKKGAEAWQLFEELCKELVELTMIGDFDDTKVISQPYWAPIPGTSTRRRDLVISIERLKEKKGLWHQLYEADIKTITFDCKNYSQMKDITAEEVYQLYEYLSPLNGKLGVILTRGNQKDKYPSNDARYAIQRLSQDGYTILILTEDDYEEWLNEYVETGNCRLFFSKRWDEYKVTINDLKPRQGPID